MALGIILIAAGILGLATTRVIQKGRDQYAERAEDYDPWYPGKKLIEDVKETPPEISIGIIAVAAVALALLFKKGR